MFSGTLTKPPIGLKTMPIPFIPYQKEYQEQMRILAALLRGNLHFDKSPQDQSSLPYPWLAGHFQQLPVEIRLAQQPTRNGSNPLSSTKYLHITIATTCPLEMSIGPRRKLWWLHRLLWWRHISIAAKEVGTSQAVVSPEQDRIRQFLALLRQHYQIASPRPDRARRLLAHRKVKSILLQLSPFHSLQLAQGQIHLSCLITSHEVFSAHRVAEILGRLLRLSRLCQNLV